MLHANKFWIVIKNKTADAHSIFNSQHVKTVAVYASVKLTLQTHLLDEVIVKILV